MNVNQLRRRFAFFTLTWVLTSVGGPFVQASSFTPMFYVHVEGEAPGATPSDVISRLNSVFIQPLATPKKIALSTFAMQVSGPKNRFYLNLVLETADNGLTGDVMSYIRSCENTSIFQARVRFQEVVEILDEGPFQLGEYDWSQPDPFVIKREVTFASRFQSLREWNAFSDRYGFAMMSVDHSIFSGFVDAYIAPSSNVVDIVNDLHRYKVVAMQPRVSLRLKNGRVISPDIQQTAFLPYRFFRNCFDSRFENGVCYP